MGEGKAWAKDIEAGISGVCELRWGKRHLNYHLSLTKFRYPSIMNGGNKPQSSQ